MNVGLHSIEEISGEKYVEIQTVNRPLCGILLPKFLRREDVVATMSESSNSSISI